MANQRVLDNNDEDKSTKGGAADQAGQPSDLSSHHAEMLGHILEDISLDEWDVVPDTPTQSAGAPETSATDLPPPEDEWAASEIIPMPSLNSPSSVPAPAPNSAAPKVETESSLFSFSLMQQFGTDPEPAMELPRPIDTPASETPVAISEPSVAEPAQFPSVSLPDKSGPVQDQSKPDTSAPVQFQSAPGSPPSNLPASVPIPAVDIPKPPVAIGPNPFLIPRTAVALDVPSDAPTPGALDVLSDAPTPVPLDVPSDAPTPAAEPAPAPLSSVAEIPLPLVPAFPASPFSSPAPTPAPGPGSASTPTLTPPSPGSVWTPTPTPSPGPASVSSLNTTPSPDPASVSSLTTTPSPGPSSVSTPPPGPSLPSPAPIVAPTPVSPPVANGQSTPSSPTPGKRKPAATLIFDSFTKSKIGLELLDPFNPNAKPQAISPSPSPVAGSASTANAPAPVDQSSAAPKQRPTARTLIFKTGMSAEGMDLSYQPLTPSSQNTAPSSPNTAPSAPNTAASHPATAGGSNPSVGPNLAAAIAAANPFSAQAPVSNPVSPENPNPAPRPNSNVIPAYNPVSGGRPIARTMILKSLPKPEQNELTEPNSISGNEQSNTVVSPETIIAAGEAAEAEAASKPKFAKRSTAPTLVFKAFTLPSADETVKRAPLKIVRYDSSKLRNLETNVKPIGIVESITAAKQASLATDDKNDRRPQWLKIIAANPLLKSPGFRSAALLIVLTTALLVCSTALMRSLSDGQDFHPTNVSAAARDQHHFKSTDGGKSFDISDKGSVLVHNGKAIHGKIQNVSDGDLFSLVTTPAAKREIWLQKTDAGYVDQDGTILYSASAPELVIAKKIDNYANIVAAKYKETKLYPSDIERLERISPKDFHYTNPFTGKVDQPVVQYKRFAAAEASWTDHTQNAHAWPDEPPWKPGGIHCVCLDYCRFFIRGFDRNGHPLYGSVPGIADYVELKDGVNMNPRRVDKISDDKDRTPAVFMVSRNPGLQMEVGVLRQVGWLLPVSLILVALAGGGWILFLRKMKSNKADSLANTTKFNTK